MKFGIVIRSTGERTEEVAHYAAINDPHVSEVKIVRNISPLYKAVLETHKIFWEWRNKYEYVISLDADVIPFPGFGKWFQNILEKQLYPKYSRWLPPLLDWVIQGRWRTAGGLFMYKSEETKEIYERCLESSDLLEPEHNYFIFDGLKGEEWRPKLEQKGEILAIHQYKQELDIYFYRGIVHTLRVKNWLRPGVQKYADEGFPEYKMFLKGIEWAEKYNKGYMNAEDSTFRNNPIFQEGFYNAKNSLNLSNIDNDKPLKYEEIISEVRKELPLNMYLINDK